MSRVGSTALRITPIPLHHADHQGHFLLRNIQLPPPVEVPQNFVGLGQMPAGAAAATAADPRERLGVVVAQERVGRGPLQQRGVDLQTGQIVRLGPGGIARAPTRQSSSRHG